MKKTALQELIENLEQEQFEQHNMGFLTTQLDKAIELAQKLLPTEQQQIEDAWNAGHLTPWDSDKTSNDYFTQTYKTTT